MLERIETAPSNVLAIRAIGEITDDDYKTVLIPALDAQIKAQGKSRFVFVIGSEFEGYSAKAGLDDALLGLEHWRDFEKIAIVTDTDWIANAMRMFMPLLPAKKQIFGESQIQDALDWAAA